MGKLFIAMCTLVLMDTLDMAAYAGAPPNHLNHATPLHAGHYNNYMKLKIKGLRNANLISLQSMMM